MNNDLSLLPASALAYTPREVLKKKTLENAALIGHLESLLRAEKCELVRLLAKQSAIKSVRPSAPYPAIVACTPPERSTVSTSSSARVSTPILSKSSPRGMSPKGVMHSFSAPHTPSTSSSAATTPEKDGPRKEMAARGSHWSFIEKARFEAALLKYGPFAWDEIIKAVGTRTEKQVKAYAARYRRRKKLAARMQALPIMTYPTMAPQQDGAHTFAAYAAMDHRGQRPTMHPTYVDVRPIKRQKTEIPHVPERKVDVRPEWHAHNEKTATEVIPAAKADPVPAAPELLHDLPPSLDILGEMNCDSSVTVPNDLELLVDQAIGGGEAHRKSEEAIVVQHDDDSYPQDLINTWLN